jgi:RNA ligase (TIGR02306 family)
MSFFAVTVQRIKRTWPIPGADAIELAEVENFTWQFVIQKGKIVVGDLVAYFPLDAIIPSIVLEKLGMVGKFSGKNHDRVKTRQFRGQISQGYVCKLDTIASFLPDIEFHIGAHITEYLGVVKYEPPVIADKAGNLLPLPAIAHGKYDIEGCNNFPAVVEKLMDTKVAIFEKLEGSNFSTGYDPGVPKLYVSQRNHTIQEIEGHEHCFWKVAREQNIIEATMLLHQRFGGTVLTRGEMLGPGFQGNIYKLPKNEVRLFDIMLDDKYVSVIQFLELTAEYGLPICPLIAKDITLREWLAGRTIDEASTGESVLFKTLREGVVIKPMVEQYDEHIGRLIIKHRSAKYLENEKE